MPPAAPPNPPLIPPEVPLVLVVILVASCVMFAMLIWRWTKQRHWVGMQDWADANGFVLRNERTASWPEVLAVLGEPKARVLVSLEDPDTWIGQVECLHRPGEKEGVARWNLLVRKVGRAWPVGALRPAGNVASVVDYLPLGRMYTLPPGERFVVYGTERAATRALGSSAARGLLPADVGLILSGTYLVLDFSGRPFDPLEFERMDAVAEQLVASLT